MVASSLLVEQSPASSRPGCLSPTSSSSLCGWYRRSHLQHSYTISTAWFFQTYEGAEGVAILLWLVKDGCWSQLVPYPILPIAFGGAAIVWFVAIIYTVARSELYSEVYLTSGLLSWLIANVCWMIGEFWGLYWVNSDDDLLYEQYEGLGNMIARMILIITVIHFMIFFLVLVPRNVFANERDHPTVQLQERTNPPCPAMVLRLYGQVTPPCGETIYFDFRFWAAIHGAAWAVKDCFWAWEMPIAYAIAFVVTIILNLDLVYRYVCFGRVTQQHQYVNIVHSIVLLLWVLANGAWAMGELCVEENEVEAISADAYRSYAFWNYYSVGSYRGEQRTGRFVPRFIAGWLFLSAFMLLVLFYVHWIYISSSQPDDNARLPSYEEYVAGIMHDGDQAVTQQQDGYCDADLDIRSKPFRSNEIARVA